MKINGDLIYKVGDTITSTSSENPGSTLGGTWTLLNTIGGGSLLSIGIMKADNSGSSPTASQYIGISDNCFGTKKIAVRKMSNSYPDLFKLESGTIKCYPNGIVGLVKATVTIGGLTSNDTDMNKGIWWGPGNHDALPSTVIILGQTEAPRGKLCNTPGKVYFGIDNIYYYSITQGATDTFYINPNFAPYNASFTPGGGGVMGLQLICEAYSIQDTLYVWKKTA